MARKKRTLAELRRHILNIIKPGQFPQVLVESEANLLGYLLEFFRDSFSLEFQGNLLFIIFSRSMQMNNTILLQRTISTSYRPMFRPATR
jgi:hypothetical protein